MKFYDDPDILLGGPLRRVVEASEKTRQLLEGPLEQISRNKDAIQAALAGPFAAVEASQRAMRAVMVEAAAAADEPVDVEAGDAEWLARWTDAVAEWRPTRQEARDFLSNLSFLLGLLLFYLTGGASLREDLLGVLVLLSAAGAIVLRYTGDDDES